MKCSIFSLIACGTVISILAFGCSEDDKKTVNPLDDITADTKQLVQEAGAASEAVSAVDNAAAYAVVASGAQSAEKPAAAGKAASIATMNELNDLFTILENGLPFSATKDIDRTVDFDMTDANGNDVFPNTTGRMSIRGTALITGGPSSGTGVIDPLTILCVTDVTISDPESNVSATIPKDTDIDLTAGLQWSFTDVDNYTYTIMVTESFNDGVVSIFSHNNTASTNVTSNLVTTYTHKRTNGQDSFSYRIAGTRTVSWTDDKDESHIVSITMTVDTGSTTPVEQILVVVDGKTYGPFSSQSLTDGFDLSSIAQINEDLTQLATSSLAEIVGNSAVPSQLIDLLNPLILALVPETGTKTQSIDKTIDLEDLSITGDNPANATGTIRITGTFTGSGGTSGSGSIDDLRITFVTDVSITDPSSGTIATFAKDGYVTFDVDQTYALKSLTDLETTFDISNVIEDLSVILKQPDEDPLNAVINSDVGVELVRLRSGLNVTSEYRVDGWTSASFIEKRITFTVKIAYLFDNSTNPPTEAITVTVNGKTYGPYTTTEFVEAFSTSKPPISAQPPSF